MSENEERVGRVFANVDFLPAPWCRIPAKAPSLRSVAFMRRVPPLVHLVVRVALARLKCIWFAPYPKDSWDDLSHVLLSEKNVEKVLDVVEMCLRFIQNNPPSYQRKAMGIVSAQEAIDEVNTRFKEHGVGFEFVSGDIVRIDSQYIHSSVVLPTFVLLSDPKFQGADNEFRSAHEHYRHGRYKECLNDCLKAFESTMKTICDIKKWNYDSKATAKTLIDVCMKNGLFSTFLQTHINNLQSILESGVPTIRNKLGGHGQGASVTTVSESTAKFTLHVTAANILHFVESAGIK